MEIAIIDYGAGNVQSVCFALERLGYSGKVTHDADAISSADKVIFPGVGAAQAAMTKLKHSGLDTLIPKLKQPVLGICLGMQLMCAHSEEGDTEGLGIFEEKVVRFPDSVKVPQIGWNAIENLKGPLFTGVTEASDIYMVHSYYVALGADTIAQTSYGLWYSAALGKNNFYGTQFHPEKSGGIGERILANFLSL
jgi:glutamine amidotransferase